MRSSGNGAYNSSALNFTICYSPTQAPWGDISGQQHVLFLGPSYSPIAGAAVPGLPRGEGAERSEVDEEWRYLADQQAGSIQMQHSFFLTGLHIYQVVPRVMRKFIFDHVKTKPKQDQFSPYEGGGG